jgi:hypothetical protein
MAIKITGKGLNILRGFKLYYPTVIFENCNIDDREIGFANQRVNPVMRPTPCFPNTTKVIVHDCSTLFTHDWIKRAIFPKLETVYLNSHPSGPMVLWRFRKITEDQKILVNLYLHDDYKKYKDKWGHFKQDKGKDTELKNIKIISDIGYKNMIDEHNIIDELILDNNKLNINCEKVKYVYVQN